ncbi:MAG TPA: phosphatase PAP2 family protein [Gemmatimonadales bacterium]|nr:phosphatase PAP2 family protein [Gemmatimonadales bacterium]
MEVLSRGFVLAMAAATVAASGRVAAWPWLLAADVLALALVELVARAPAAGRVGAAISLWYPYLLIPAYYWQLGVLSLGAQARDPLVQRWEAAIFGGQVSVTWHQASASPLLSSVLHACYLAHYAIIIGVPVWLFLRSGREACARALFGITLAFYVCYLCFAVFPVAGPYYALPAPTGPMENLFLDRLVRGVLESGSSWGTAFPSSHVAASWCAVLMARRHAPWLAAVLAPVALGLAAGTVYGQFHYAVDALAGAAVAVACFALADPLRTWLARRPAGRQVAAAP